MREQKHPSLEAFISLGWYEVFLRFLANFVAKSAEILLAAGLIVSSANFLTDGDVLGTGSLASEAWSWTQSLAIDSGLGISFYYVLQCLKQRDWLKFGLYSLLTLVLTLVAGIITYGDIFSHAIHTPIHDAMTLLGIDVRLLSILRAIAVVGFVLMSRLRDVSFKDLAAPEPPPSRHETSSALQVSKDPGIMAKRSGAEPLQPTIEDMALLLQALARARGTTLVSPDLEEQERFLPVRGGAPVERRRQLGGSTLYLEPEPTQSVAQTDPPVKEPESHTARGPEPAPRSQSQAAPVPSEAPRSHAEGEQDAPSPDQEMLSADQEGRLEHTYQELLAQGEKISARSLAKGAHIHRSTCSSWLLARRLQQPTPESLQERSHQVALSSPEELDQMEP